MKNIALILATTVLGLSAANAADGAKAYTTCLPCHQANGEGLPGAFPPLAGSEWVNGPVENLIRIQLRGLMGPITVKGAQYNSAMPPNAAMSDDEIAAVLTHIRSNFGNKASAVTAAQVKALRSEVGKPMLKAEDLIDPKKAPAADKKPASPKKDKPATEEKSVNAETPATPIAAAAPLKTGATTASGKVTKTEHAPRCKEKITFGAFGAWTILCLLPVITGFGRKA